VKQRNVLLQLFLQSREPAVKILLQIGRGILSF